MNLLKGISYRDFVLDLGDGKITKEQLRYAYDMIYHQAPEKEIFYFFKDVVSAVQDAGKYKFHITELALNNGNWGINKDGIYKCFDIGFQLLKKPPESLKTINLKENTLLSFNIPEPVIIKLIEKLKLKGIKRIGSGNYGDAYDIGKNIIMKVTLDGSEAANSFKIKGKSLKNIAKIYNVLKLNANYSTYYVIFLEKLDTFDGEIHDEIEYYISKINNIFHHNAFKY